MNNVYEASTGLEAHMVMNLLQQEGIDAQIEGEYLQGGIGELQAINIVRVIVPEHSELAATKIITEWEKMQAVPVEYEQQFTLIVGFWLFLLGFLMGIAIMYLTCGS